MPEESEPYRAPIAERVTGVVTLLAGAALLSSRKLTVGETIAQGELVIRYGITYLGKPHVTIVPDLVVADYGELLRGEEAWRFLMDKGHLYPRADVCGRRNDGQEDMVALKQLDLDGPYDVYVYGRESERQPLAQVSALIAVDRAKFPRRLARHLSTFASLDQWRADG